MTSDLFQLAPLLLVTLAGISILTMDLFRRRGEGGGTHLVWLTTAGLAVALWLTWNLWPGDGEGITSAFLAGSVMVDGYTLFVWSMLLVATIAVVLYSHGFDFENNLDNGEYYCLLLFVWLA